LFYFPLPWWERADGGGNESKLLINYSPPLWASPLTGEGNHGDILIRSSWDLTIAVKGGMNFASQRHQQPEVNIVYG
jgi:hypothetical protein